MIRMLLALTAVFSVSTVLAEPRPWENAGLSDAERVEHLLEAMTIDEKMGQLMYNAPGIERLGISPYT